ncbi:MAG: hydroxysqualene dehydroxylase HpnE [Terriglobales bacterium]|jgi:zeta-carotene desaturase
MKHEVGKLAPTVAVVGGGLAGLAAGTALASAGFKVTLLERKPFLGGRASSYELPGADEVVDNCQHVVLGCCTNLIDFYRRIGASDLVRWYDHLTFIEPGGRQSVISPSWLPAPFHAARSFLRAPMLAGPDKRAIARALAAFASRLPADDGRPFSQWLLDRGQSAGAIEHFWKPVLVSSLNEDLERISLPAAALVFRESFMKSAQGGRMGLPRVPLSDLYSRAGEYIRANGGTIEMRAAVEQVEPFQEKVLFAPRLYARVSVNNVSQMFDYAVSALPFDQLMRILPDVPELQGLRTQLGRFETTPITGIHIWFDRQITKLDHAVLLDRTIQWMFHKSRILGTHRQDGSEGTNGSYVELVVSASKSLVDLSRKEIIEMAIQELVEFFPAVWEARPLKATVVKEINATFAPLPGVDANRPPAQTPWPRVFLAGDWTATGWPATMESAVRSGYLAAEAICRTEGTHQRFLVPDLPPSGFMRLLGN